jgi:hypothetical protein
MTLDDILETWKNDSKIHESKLDESSLQGAIMHAKYLELYSISKLKLKRKEYESTVLKKDKWLYYNGRMSKVDMDKHGWPYDPFQGCNKPLKCDMDMFYNTDSDISKLKMVIEYQQVIVDTLKEILDTLRWRHNTIKNIIEFRKFAAGS